MKMNRNQAPRAVSQNSSIVNSVQRAPHSKQVPLLNRHPHKTVDFTAWSSNGLHVAPHKFQTTNDGGDDTTGDAKHERSPEPAINKEIHRQQPRIVFA